MGIGTTQRGIARFCRQCRQVFVFVIDIYAGDGAAAGTAGPTAASLPSRTYLPGYFSIVFLHFLTNFFHKVIPPLLII
jgi:hypothetical protein